MGTTAGNLQDVAELIRLAVAPIFLLMAVASTLMVFAGRLARIVDRGRLLEAQAAPVNNHNREQLFQLEKRAQMIYRALFLGVSAAIIMCLMMTIVFAGAIYQFNAAQVVAVLFVAALFAYTGALICLLREVFLAIGNFRLGIQRKGN